MGAAIMSNQRRHTDQGAISAYSFSNSLDIEWYLASGEMTEQVEIDADAHCRSTERLVTALVR